MVPRQGLESVCATRVVNAVGLKRNVRQNAPQETFWTQTMAMSVSARVPANTSVSVLTMPLLTLVDVHKAPGHVRTCPGALCTSTSVSRGIVRTETLVLAGTLALTDIAIV